MRRVHRVKHERFPGVTLHRSWDARRDLQCEFAQSILIGFEIANDLQGVAPSWVALMFKFQINKIVRV